MRRPAPPLQDRVDGNGGEEGRGRGKFPGPYQLDARWRMRQAEAPALCALLCQARLNEFHGPGPGPGSKARLRLHGSLLQAQLLLEHHICVQHHPLDLTRGRGERARSGRAEAD